MSDEFLTLRQCAKLRGVTLQTIRNWRKAKKLPEPTGIGKRQGYFLSVLDKAFGKEESNQSAQA